MALAGQIVLLHEVVALRAFSYSHTEPVKKHIELEKLQRNVLFMSHVWLIPSRIGNLKKKKESNLWSILWYSWANLNELRIVILLHPHF